MISLLMICLLVLAAVSITMVAITITQEVGLKNNEYYHINLK